MFNLIVACILGLTPLEQAKNAFDNVNGCDKNCTCWEGKCKCSGGGGECQCKNCNCVFDSDRAYREAIERNQVLILAIGCDVDLKPHRVIRLKMITGESSGFIIGIPKNGKLVRLDLPTTATRERVRLEILHVLFPVTEGYTECPTCPEGRRWVGRTMLQQVIQNNCRT